MKLLLNKSNRNGQYTMEHMGNITKDEMGQKSHVYEQELLIQLPHRTVALLNTYT